jgi:tRNA U34 5-methylaminomethyl-2-thiouridine-forming methyltransferase MnmC
MRHYSKHGISSIGAAEQHKEVGHLQIFAYTLTNQGEPATAERARWRFGLLKVEEWIATVSDWRACKVTEGVPNNVTPSVS